MKFFLLVISILLTTFPVSAYEYYIRGNLPCTEISNISKNNPEEFNRYVYWLGGYISGYNYEKDKATGKGINIGCIADEVRSFCELNKSLTLGDSIADAIKRIENPKSAINNSNKCKL